MAVTHTLCQCMLYSIIGYVDNILAVRENNVITLRLLGENFADLISKPQHDY